MLSERFYKCSKTICLKYSLETKWFQTQHKVFNLGDFSIDTWTVDWHFDSKVEHSWVGNQYDCAQVCQWVFVLRSLFLIFRFYINWFVFLRANTSHFWFLRLRNNRLRFDKIRLWLLTLLHWRKLNRLVVFNDHRFRISLHQCLLHLFHFSLCFTDSCLNDRWIPIDNLNLRFNDFRDRFCLQWYRLRILHRNRLLCLCLLFHWEWPYAVAKDGQLILTSEFHVLDCAPWCWVVSFLVLTWVDSDVRTVVFILISHHFEVNLFVRRV